MTQFLRFGVVGTFLFVLDAFTFAALLQLGMPVIPSRLAAICLAVLTSWLVNRSWTFKEQHGATPPSLGEFTRFACTQAVGAGVNVLVSLAAYSLLAVGTWAAVAAGSIAGLLVNFAGAKWLVFRRD